MRTILVTGTNDSTGKTAVTLALALIAKERGDSVGYMKPLGTRLRSAVGKTRDEDPLLARDLLELTAALEDLEPVVYSPTFVDETVRGRQDPGAVRERVRAAFETLSEDKDLLLVEAGGPPATGGVVDLTHADIAEMFDADVLALGTYREGSDIDAVLALADHIGDRLNGVLFNAVPDVAQDDLEGEVVGFLEGRNVPVMGIIGRDPTLAGITIADLADELGATVLTSQGPTDTRIERFQVGAMSAESALRHFRRTSDAAVITGGDRADVQTAALQAPGVKCLILTGGHRPSNSVLGKAEEHEVPVMLVQADTVTAVDRAERVLRTGRTRSAEAVRHMRDLLTDHADLSAILDG